MQRAGLRRRRRQTRQGPYVKERPGGWTDSHRFGPSDDKPMQQQRSQKARRMKKKATPALAWKPVVTRQQLAALMGVHPDRVSHYTRDGMPVLNRGGHGRESAYDAVECLAWLRLQGGQDAKTAAQTRSYNASARLNELKHARETGLLVSREQVIREGRACIVGWKAKILSLAQRAAQHGVIELGQVRRLQLFCRDILTDISQWKTVADCQAAIEETEAANG